MDRYWCPTENKSCKYCGVEEICLIPKSPCAEENKKREGRFIKGGHGSDTLTAHEVNELRIDFDIDTTGYYILAPLTKKEWELINKKEK